MTDEQIKKIATKFMEWRLPLDFRPEMGVSFTAPLTDYMRQRNWPKGKHLFTIDQVQDMLYELFKEDDTEESYKQGDDICTIKKQL